MLLGDKSRFGIEVEVFDKRGGNTFGTISLWVGNDQIGNAKQTVMLDVAADHFTDSLQINRDDSTYDTLPAVQAWHLLQHNSFGDGDGTAEKFNICVNFSESFDGESLFLVVSKGIERFIWKSFNGKIVKELKLPLGSFSSVIQDFLVWFRF